MNRDKISVLHPCSSMFISGKLIFNENTGMILPESNSRQTHYLAAVGFNTDPRQPIRLRGGDAAESGSALRVGFAFFGRVYAPKQDAGCGESDSV